MTIDRKYMWTVIGVTVTISGLLTYWGIQGIGVYGMSLFIMTPLFIGAGPVIVYGRKYATTRKQALKIGFLTLAVYTLGLVAFAIEGLICVVMAAPIGLFLTWVGVMFGHAIIKRPPQHGPASLVLLALVIPCTAFLEKHYTPAPGSASVTTAIEIDASPREVWRNVIAFSTIKQPREFIFRTGIAYPVNAEIKGKGVGAIRYCNFSTGSFVEPITVWDEPRLLKFDVADNPPTMRELSFFDVNAPHLHGYFVSKKGEFRLSQLSNGKTLLEGTTWYEHNIRPVLYWKLWSDYIIGKIHLRVLTDIKQTSEKTFPTSLNRQRK